MTQLDGSLPAISDGYEHNRYARNLAAIISWGKAPAADGFKGVNPLDGVATSVLSHQTLPVATWEVYGLRLRDGDHPALSIKESQSQSVTSFWKDASLVQKQKLAFIAERTMLMEQQHIIITKSAFEQDQIIRENFTKRLVNDHPEKQRRRRDVNDGHIVEAENGIRDWRWSFRSSRLAYRL
ncbi:hypothetical protein BC937DRAFT_89574 [Endogone sp. FLAS-F59071]|nr:hypothetical protein BC937DRAFT_89574 [Endogone sp. FLAS-F59071]|eukprot:RUS23265.1 hypothetical protein BC937DRAFT_89574 [Endogone sp. FLAS-F59071]